MGREEVDKSTRRVGSTHAWRGRLSRSEISTSGELVDCEVTTRVVVVGLSATVLTLVAIHISYLKIKKVKITCGYFLFWLYSSRLRGSSRFRLRPLRLGRLLGGGHF